MNRRLMLTFACLAMIFALGGCSSKDTGDHNTPSTTSPSVTPSTGVNDGHEADESGKVENSPDSTDAGTSESTTTDTAKSKHNTPNTDVNGDGLLHDVGDAVKDVADGTERAVRDIM